MARPGQCFISYSHHDHGGFERLLAHLTAVAGLYRFKLWHDRRTNAGYVWHRAIVTEIEKSDIFIPLVTNDFFASDYISGHELPAMLDRNQNAEALLIPVVYRESCWRNYFGNYVELVPKNSKHNLVPVFKWRDREEAFAVAANAISSSIEEWFGVKPYPIFPTPAASAGGNP
jgi:TIR domain